MSSFKDLMNKNNNFNQNAKIGSIVEGIVGEKINIKGQEYFLVDAGLKYEGIILVNELKNMDLSSKISFFIINERENYFILSYEKARKEMQMLKIREIYNNRESIECQIISKFTEGYKVLIFDEIPAVLNTTNEFELDSKTFAFVSKIFNNGNIILKETANGKVNQIKPGDIVTGQVLSFNDYFAFIKLDNSDMEGIVYAKDLSWEEIHFPGEVVIVKQVLELKVLKIQNKFLFLSLREMTKDPWLKLEEKFKDLDKVYEGKIKSINDYELLIDMGENITGTIHISEISWGFRKGSSLSKDFNIGEVVKYKFLEIDKKHRKIRLSMKQLTENPFLSFVKNHKVGDIVEGTVLHDSRAYGSFLFVELAPGIDGMLHQSEIDWNPEIGLTKFTNLEKNQKIQVKIINIDTEKMRISVSIKRMKSDLFEESMKKAVIGNIYDVEVIGTSVEGLSVIVKDVNDCLGFIRRSEISNAKNIRLKNFDIGSVIKAKLTAIHDYKRIFIFSIKALQIDENKNAIKGNENISSQTSFGSFINEKD